MTEIEDQKSLLLMEFLNSYYNGVSEEEMADLIKRTETCLKGSGWNWIEIDGYGAGV